MASIAQPISFSSDGSNLATAVNPRTGNNAEAMKKVMSHLVNANAALLRMPNEAIVHIQSAKALVAAFLESSEPVLTRRSNARGGLTPWQIRQVESYIFNNIESRINVETLAGVVGLSVGHFCRAFKTSFGRPPQAHLIERRIEAAKLLMLSCEDPLAEISIACGFSDQSHFSHSFRRCIGQSPGEWRKSNKQTNTPGGCHRISQLAS